ncbi:MAG: cation-translocating P-type ATPase [Clostridiales bacterium]|nr:cation-translocating P-type ATPase [Clostridiales bacterium]
MEKAFSKKSEEIVSELGTDLEQGLSAAKAEEILSKVGPNSLGEAKKTPLWKRFLGQFADAMVFILLGAAALSAVMAVREGGGFKSWIDVIVILAIVVLNAVLGVYQEGKADEAIAALKKMSAPQTKVIRDGKVVMIDSDKVVPGDIVNLDAGDSVSADMRLFYAGSLKIDEASLTGESVPVEKNAEAVLAEDCSIGDRSNMAYMGTAVTYGRGKGIVVATGKDTELGKIANKLSNIEDEITPLQRNLNSLGKVLAIVCIIVCVIVFVVDLVVQKQSWDNALMTAVSLAVAAIPEGLSAVVTIVLALGMTKMATKNAVVRKLLAVETLGCVDVICSDKTGTLTQNQMTVKKLFDGKDIYDVTGNGYGPEGKILDPDGVETPLNDVLKRLVQAAVLCNDASINVSSDGKYTCIGDPTEGSLTTLGLKTSMASADLNQKFPRKNELPFDSDRKMMTTYHSGIVEGKFISFTKGAPDVVLSRCTKYFDGTDEKEMTPEVFKRIEKINHDFATKAIRVLAFGYRTHDNVDHEDFEHETNMVFIGLIGMIDPAREEAKDAIKVCHEAGIRAVMITGDYKDTAVAIAEDLNMMGEGVNAMSGTELDQTTDEQLLELCEYTNVYARVSPEHKVRIVESLKKKDHIASMTGDGVNDAMALKTADIGVAMGITGTDVAKNSADMILMDDNFATIVSAVEEGRVIYSNIRKFVAFLLSCNVGEILVIFLISLIPNSVVPGIAAPLTAIQLLWLNLITDSFPALALGREKGEPNIMKVPPRSKDEPIINKPMKITIACQAIAIFVTVATAFITALLTKGGIFFDASGEAEILKGARTVAFATLILAELFRAFAARSESVSVFKIGLFSNKFMNISVLLAIVLLFAVIYIPGVNMIFGCTMLNPMAWLVIVPLAFVPFAASEIMKLIKNKKK